MTRNGYGLGRTNGRGMGGRGNGRCLRDGTGFGSGRGQGRRRCRFEESDRRWGFFASNALGGNPFAGAISRIESVIDELKRQINDLRQKS